MLEYFATFSNRSFGAFRIEYEYSLKRKDIS